MVNMGKHIKTFTIKGFNSTMFLKKASKKGPGKKHFHRAAFCSALVLSCYK